MERLSRSLTDSAASWDRGKGVKRRSPGDKASSKREISQETIFETKNNKFPLKIYKRGSFKVHYHGASFF